MSWLFSCTGKKRGQKSIRGKNDESSLKEETEQAEGELAIGGEAGSQYRNLEESHEENNHHHQSKDEENTKTSIEETQILNQGHIEENPECVYPHSGRGLCVVIANFVGDDSENHLPGYIHDKNNLTEFFGKLNYTVISNVDGMELQNLSLGQFREGLRKLQVAIERIFTSQRHDKFLMFVLSHGGENGLYTCSDVSGKDFEKDEHQKLAFITVDEIIDAFTHHDVSSLAGIPKCFFFQACRGENPLIKPAANSDNQPPEPLDDCMDGVLKKPALKRANVLAAYATPEKSYCWVREHNRGSFFVESIINTIQERCRVDNILEIMTRVISDTSINTHSEWFRCNDPKNQIQVKDEAGKYQPFLIYGEVEGTKVPMCAETGYKVYKKSMLPDYYLVNYEFKGKVECKPGNCEGTLTFKDWFDSQNLKIFSDPRLYSIYGQMRYKGMGARPEELFSCSEQYIAVSGNMFDLHEPKMESKSKCTDLFGLLCESGRELRNLEGLYLEAKVYRNNDLCCTGYLSKAPNGVWGVKAEVYQLPVIASTLTKKMYLTSELPKQDQSFDYRNVDWNRIMPQMFNRSFGREVVIGKN